MKVVAMLPCFNERGSISDLVFQTNKMVDCTIVADDSSSDGTAEVASKAGAYIVRNFGKRGAGFNTKAGIDEALIRECDVVVTLDGDGQHDAREIPRLLNPIERGEADVVVGSRFLSGDKRHIPAYRKFGIKVITYLYNLGSSQKLTDAQCCFRAYSRAVLEQVRITERGFSFSVETLIKARALGFRIKEVPVTVLYHKQYSQNSSLNPVRHGLSVALGTVKWRIKVEAMGKIRRLLQW